jgi:hypothetical protein
MAIPSTTNINTRSYVLKCAEFNGVKNERCAVAFKQAALAGTKTLTPHTLRLIQELGYTVRVQEQTV